MEEIDICPECKEHCEFEDKDECCGDCDGINDKCRFDNS
jgi:hypothetical protein